MKESDSVHCTYHTVTARSDAEACSKAIAKSPRLRDMRLEARVISAKGNKRKVMVEYRW